MTSEPTRLDDDHLDPTRWVTLVLVLLAAFIVVLDNTVLNVSIPTILRDFHTTLPALEWVVTGYALMFATLLIIGGRLGDIYGHRRIFIIGTALFGVGSFIASVSTGGSRARARRGDHRGHRRVADAAGDARAALGHVPGARAGDGVRGVGRERRCRGRVRAGRRRVPDDQLLVALVVPDQRHHRPDRDHRRGRVHARQREHARGASSSTSSAPRSSPSECSCSSSH